MRVTFRRLLRLTAGVLPAVLVLMLGSTAASAPSTIYRAFLSLELGMPIDAFLETVPAEEIANRGDEQRFRVSGDHADLTGLVATFTDERLSRIEATYSPAFSSRMSWRAFVETATRKYGTGFHLPTPGGDVEMWDDGYTTLILERRPISGKGHAYTLTLLDDAVALEHSSQCPPRIEV
jgi:hypothetical protein